MDKRLSTETQVKSALGIETWRNLSKDKVMELISILPNVDSDVAIKIIEQFPEFAKTSSEMIGLMKDLCNTALQEASTNTKLSIESYQKVLDELSEILKHDDLSSDDRKYFANKMIEVADKIGLKDTEDKNFKGKMLNTVGGVILGVLAIGAGILGTKFINTNGKDFLKK